MRQYAEIIEITFQPLSLFPSHNLSHCAEFRAESIVAMTTLCTFCQKYFSDARNLKIHVGTHKEEKPFACIDCAGVFTEAFRLRNHQKLHETDSKPFSLDHPVNLRAMKCFTPGRNHSHANHATKHLRKKVL